MDKPVFKDALDVASGVLMPLYDPDLHVMYLGGKASHSKHSPWHGRATPQPARDLDRCRETVKLCIQLLLPALHPHPPYRLTHVVLCPSLVAG